MCVIFRRLIAVDVLKTLLFTATHNARILVVKVTMLFARNDPKRPPRLGVPGALLLKAVR